MRNFFLARRLSMMMVFAIIIMLHGSNSLFAGHYIAGIVVFIVGFIAYIIFDRDFTIPADDRVYESEIVPDSSLLPIEWDKQFDEPPANIPNEFWNNIKKG